MTQNTWIAEEWLFAGKGMQVGATNADAPDARLNLVGQGRTGLWYILDLHVANRTQNNLPHANLLWC
jgi:hypothetical protein